MGLSMGIARIVALLLVALTLSECACPPGYHVRRTRSEADLSPSPFFSRKESSFWPRFNLMIMASGWCREVEMDSGTESLAKLREVVRRGEQRSERRNTYEATMPQIKMIVSNWYTDELGNRARIIRACD
jgi:hypothetical protein